MQVEVDTQAILASPFDRFEEVLPRDLSEERFSLGHFNGVVAEGNADPSQPSCSNLGKVSLGDESRVVMLDDLRKPAPKILAERPLVNSGLVGVDEGFKEAWSDEWFENEPAVN